MYSTLTRKFFALSWWHLHANVESRDGRKAFLLNTSNTVVMTGKEMP